VSVYVCVCSFCMNEIRFSSGVRVLSVLHLRQIALLGHARENDCKIVAKQHPKKIMLKKATAEMTPFFAFYNSVNRLLKIELPLLLCSMPIKYFLSRPIR